jgi:hypothetical protein
MMAVENDFYVQAINTDRLHSLNYLQLDEDSQAQTSAEWGFLKNIVNIDTFFATDPSNKPERKSNLMFKQMVQQSSQQGHTTITETKPQSPPAAKQAAAQTKEDKEKADLQKLMEYTQVAEQAFSKDLAK